MWPFGCGLFLGVIVGFLVGIKSANEANKRAKN